MILRPDSIIILRRQSFILECIANSLDATNSSVDTFFLIYAASLVFYMQTGFAMLCAGSVRIKNLQNTMLKNILDACGASLGFYTVGYAFAFGGNGDSEKETTFIGTENFFLMGVEEKAVWLFQFSFAATSATIVAGTLAERSQMLAYLCYSAAMTAFVYPVAAHSIWNSAGFLSPYNADPFLGTGTVDFAGCLVVHVTGGLTALIAAKILGPRKGRFYQVDGKITVNDFPGHSIALKVSLWYMGAGSPFSNPSFSNHLLESPPRPKIGPWCIYSLVLLVWFQYWFGLPHNRRGRSNSCSKCCRQYHPCRRKWRHLCAVRQGLDYGERDWGARLQLI